MWWPRSRPARAPSATPTRARPATSAIAAIKVGEEFVAPTAEGAAKVVAVSPRVEGRGANDMAIEVDRTTTESGAYPLILLSYLIACPTYDDAERGRPGQGLPRLHRVARRASRPPPRRPAPRRSTPRWRTRPPASSTGSQSGSRSLHGDRDAASRPPVGSPQRGRRTTRSDATPTRSSVTTTTEAEQQASPPTQRGRPDLRRPRPRRRHLHPGGARGVFIFLAVEGIPGVEQAREQLRCRSTASGPTSAGCSSAPSSLPLIALVIAVPFALGIALFISHYAPRRAGRAGRLRHRPARRRAVGGLRPLGRPVLAPLPGAGPRRGSTTTSASSRSSRARPRPPAGPPHRRRSCWRS